MALVVQQCLQKDRYKQIFLNNKAAFDHLGFSPESLVVPDTQIGYRFGANTMGLDVTSQAGVESFEGRCSTIGSGCLF
jgi:hypothetical protein